MTGKEANEMLDWWARRPQRVRRYLLEGGTRRRFDCLRCGCATEAHSPDEAGENLTRYGAIEPRAAACCGDHAIVKTGYIVPPIDFS